MNEIMVHLDHPCYGVDVWEVSTGEEYQTALKQGYFSLRELCGVNPPNNGNQDELLPHTSPHVEWDDEYLIDNEGDFV